jgi:hypothetical protein
VESSLCLPEVLAAAAQPLPADESVVPHGRFPRGMLTSALLSRSLLVTCYALDGGEAVLSK